MSLYYLVFRPSWQKPSSSLSLIRTHTRSRTLSLKLNACIHSPILVTETFQFKWEDFKV
ncbi:hypothetical protein RDWZM_000251, partial [Blomia tropicalis]